jgi:uncharacterized protein YbbC (DUF1343 family)
MSRVGTGLDVLAADRFEPLRGRRAGVIANPASVNRRMRHLIEQLRVSPGIELRALFGPEHGLDAAAQDMIGVGSSRDASTDLPIYSLYGDNVASLRPTPEQLDGLDCLVFDLQDVGSRYYTFAATMLYAMEAAVPLGLSFIVLDRPNPLGGETVSGPTIRPGYESFVGAHPVPIRHGMTVGELAGLYRAERNIDIDLTVIPCEGLSRSMLWRDTGLHWVAPSPNMPTPETAQVYPGGCLIEGTNLSEGRGTTHPFEWWGAPWLDARAIADWVPEAPGVLLRPCAFRPNFHKHAGQTCRGVQPHVTDPAAFDPLLLYTDFIAEARHQAPEPFTWRIEPYELVSHPIAIDLLYGSSRERAAIEEGWGPDEREGVQRDWAAESREFLERRRPFLLYD